MSLTKKKECEQELTQKGEVVERLQVKASNIGIILSNLEKKYNNSNYDEQQFFKKSPSGHQLGYGNPQNKKPHPKIQQIPPFNASRIKKSPSANDEIEIKAEDPPVNESIKEDEDAEKKEEDEEE